MSEWITPPPERLSEEDRRRIEQVVHSGYNETDRAPFRPWRLFVVLWLILMVFGFGSWGLARYYGVL